MVALFSVPTASPQATPRVQIVVERPARRIVTDAHAGGYQAFPDVCRLKNGDLLCVFYAGYAHISFPKEGLPNGGRVCAVRSKDDGKTWSEPWTVVDTPLDDRDPSICCLPDGTVLCNFFTYREGGAADTMIARSTDGGATWNEPELVLPSFATSSPIRRLRSGRLLLPVYTVDGAGRKYAAVCVSDDRGKTWGVPRTIGLNAGKTIDETDLYERRDGTILAVSREVMTESESRDGGLSWTEPRDLGFKGHCPYLLMTKQGVLLLAHRVPQTSLNYSLDEGRSWSENLQLDDVIGAYPSMVQLKDGRVLCVYYEEGLHSAIRAVTIKVNVAKQ